MNKVIRKLAVVVKCFKALSKIQVERMPYVPGSNPRLGLYGRELIALSQRQSKYIQRSGLGSAA